MQMLRYLALSAALIVMLSLGAFAKTSNSGNFTLFQKARIGSTVLAPGDYKAEWTGPNNAVTVSIVQYGKTIATAKGSLKELPTKAQDTAVTLRTTHNNNQRVEEIDFNNRTEALLLSGS